MCRNSSTLSCAGRMLRDGTISDGSVDDVPPELLNCAQSQARNCESCDSNSFDISASGL